MRDYEIAEALMLIVFSASWDWSIARMLRVRAAVGKSPAFVTLIRVGHVFGVVSKLAAWRATGVLSDLVWLCSWNLLVTPLDLFLVLHFGRGGGRPGRVSA